MAWMAEIDRRCACTATVAHGPVSCLSPLAVMPRISLLLPCLQADSAFEDTLASLLRTRPAGADVIVVHDGSYQDQYGLAGEVEYAVAASKRLIAYWNAGWDAAVGDFLVWVRPGAQLDDGWELACLEAFSDPAVGAVGPKLQVQSAGEVRTLFGLATTTTGTRILSSRSRAELLGPTSWTAAYRQTALGWLDPLDLVWEDEYLDTYLALALRKLGYRYQVAENWEVLVDGAPAEQVEQSRPHGLSAARAAIRFGQPLQTGLSACLKEDLPRLWSQSWRWKHFRDRMKVSRFRSADQHAAQQFEERAVKRQRIVAQSNLTAGLAQSAEARSQVNQSVRRAA